MTGAASARIAARQPLLRAGLERIARAAEVDLVESCDAGSGAADMVLRTFEIVAEDAGIDVAIADGLFVITCRSRPEPGVWDAVGRIIDAATTG